MYDEVMQLISLAKNDEKYFQRIEDLKQKQLELAHVKEIAATLGDADMHLAKAKQAAKELLTQAEIEAAEVKQSVLKELAEAKEEKEKAKQKLKDLKAKEDTLGEKEKSLETLKQQLEKEIQEHRRLTAERTKEQEEAQKVKVSFESKLKQLREIAAQP